jgi:acyl dehydratase
MRASIDVIRVGDTASCDVLITEEAVASFARLSADTNPLHLDAEVARGYGFTRPVAHGLLALSAVSRLIGTRLPGPGSLWVSQELRFVMPVLVGDRLIARVSVQQVSKAVGLVSLKTEVTNFETGASVLTGTARVKILPRVDAATQS